MRKEEIVYNDVEELVQKMTEKMDCILDEADTALVCCAAKYDEARTVIADLVEMGFKLERVELEPEYLDYYDKEYIITIDENLNIWCEKAYSMEKGKYLSFSADVLFLNEYCSTALLKSVFDDTCEIVYMYGYEYDREPEHEDKESKCDKCTCDCCNCKSDKDEDLLKRYNLSKNDVEFLFNAFRLLKFL